ncbi:MAG: hypothetical protein JRH15_19625 [Deltaproteobacteria bacterium]|nr:hypothetical protein [Deltaproteobacteria bacterium]
MQLILEACIRAANASNRQSYSIVVIKDRTGLSSGTFEWAKYCPSRQIPPRNYQ